MSPQREWKTEGEIRAIVHDETEGVLDRLLDGAQASINTATILHGSPELGLKGVLPEIQERLKALEDGQERDRDINEERHKQNTGRLESLEAGQHKIRRCLGWMNEKAELVGKEWKLVGACSAALGVGFSMPTMFSVVRRVATFIGHALR